MKRKCKFLLGNMFLDAEVDITNEPVQPTKSLRQFFSEHREAINA